MSEVKPNQGQLKVINHSGGPLLVVAGAGTGKTFVIIEHINKLLNNGVEPEEILAVTFTEKAASEMLGRLLDLSNSLQLEIPIMTFNAFGESLLREFGTHIGVGRNFRLLGEQAQLVFIRERIDFFKLDYFLPLTNLPDAILDDLRKHFSTLKQHLITPKDYQAYAHSIANTSESERMERNMRLELSNAYRIYIELCRSENVIDYDDQIYLLVELLKLRPNIKQQLQARYHTIMIDEFQDTNPMQSTLIDLVVGSSRNLIVVGDDDQSIYGFRGATLANILEFKSRYPDAKETALTQNYRSGQAILDVSYKLIQHNNPNRLESSLKIDKKLIGLVAGKKPTVHHFSEIDEELQWISQDIAKRLKVGELPGNIAVLARRRATAKLVHGALDQLGVPHRLIGYRQDLYRQGATRMLLEAFRTLAEPHNNSSLHHTLTSELFGVANSEIVAEASKARYEHELLETVLLENPKAKDSHQAIAMIRQLRDQLTSTSAGRLAYRLIDQTGYKDRLFKAAETDNEAANAVQNINQLFQSVKAFESIATQPTMLGYLESLPALQAAGEQTDDDTALISSDEVNVMTIHKAKGLEWSVVYIPDCTEGSFPLVNRPSGLGLPATLKGAKTSPADEHYSEERRLMYVAATRAKQSLLFTYSDRHRTPTPRKPSRFLSEMFGVGEVVLTELIGTNMQTTAVNVAEKGELIESIAVPTEIYDGKTVRLTVSQAATLLNCPKDFYYKFVLKAPQAPTPSTTYGVVMHDLIEQINGGIIDGDLPSLTDLEHYLEVNWNKAGYASKSQQQRAYLQAKKTLSAFYKRAPKETMQAELVEEPFEAELDPEGIILRGRYDVILRTPDGEVEIRDYKTTISVQNPEKAKQRAQSSVQLTMYALAWQLSHGELPSRLSLDFVDTGLIGYVKKTDRGVSGLRLKLGEVVDQLKQSSFPFGTKHDYCIHPAND